jgi:hypothetical protein
LRPGRSTYLASIASRSPRSTRSQRRRFLAWPKEGPNFYEKALFVKPTWRPWIMVEYNGFLSALRALCFYPHSQGAHTLSLVARCTG